MTGRAAADGYRMFIVEGALYHKGEAVTDFAQEPRNERELYSLPGYSPELNPQEHVWKFFGNTMPITAVLRVQPKH